MYKELLNAMIKKLEELFPKARIRTTPMEEGIMEPYFQVGILESTEKHVNGQRYLRSISMYADYDPKNSEQPFMDINLVLGVLMDELEFLSLEDGSLLRGSNRKGKNKEGILHFLVDFDVYILKTKELEASMGDLNLKE